MPDAIGGPPVVVRSAETVRRDRPGSRCNRCWQRIAVKHSVRSAHTCKKLQEGAGESSRATRQVFCDEIAERLVIAVVVMPARERHDAHGRRLRLPAET